MNTEHRNGNVPHITVCICTYKRPLLLRRLLEDLKRQDTGEVFTFSIVVADNDRSESAKLIVNEFAAETSGRVTYCVEPQQNIALARNKAIENAKGDLIALIDDDEFPSEGWLRNLFVTCKTHNVAGVLGPVKPYFEHDPPQWLRKGGFFERPTYHTGYRVGMWESRTGNALFQRSIISGLSEPFRAEFGAGGEDVDFFGRMIEKGNVFIWCNEATVYEMVPPERCTRKYLLRKALFRGGNFLKHPADRTKNVFKSFVAIPIYLALLPILCVAGHHHFMRYLEKLCNHTGRVLMVVGIKLIREREPQKRTSAA